MKILLITAVLLSLGGCLSLDPDGRGSFQPTSTPAILHGTDTIVECKYNVGCYEVQQP